MTHNDKIQDLITFLTANVDLSNLDGRPDKAAKYAEMLETVRELFEDSKTLRKIDYERDADYDWEETWR